MSTWNLLKGYLSYSDFFFLAALLLHAPRALRQWRQLGGAPVLLVVSGVLLTLSDMITYAIGAPQSEPINAAKLVFSLCVFPLLIVLVTAAGRRQIDLLLAAWLAGAVLSASVAFTSIRGIEIPGMYDAVAAAGGRASGLSYHPNGLGYTCALLIPVVGYLWGRTRRRLERLLLAAALLMLLYGLHTTGSRASLLALLSGLLLPVAGLLRRQIWPMLATALVGLIAAGLLAFTLILELNLEGILDELRESAIGRALGLSLSSWHSNVARSTYIDFSWAQFLETPLFGAGYGWLRGAHIHALAILHSGGLFGLTAVLLWLLSLFNASHRISLVRRRAGLAGYSALHVTAIAGVIVWFVNGALQPLLPDRNGYILIGVLFALDALARRRLFGLPLPAGASSPPVNAAPRRPSTYQRTADNP